MVEKEKVGWWKRFVCFCFGHSPNMIQSKFYCCKCGCRMDYINSMWVEIDDEIDDAEMV